MKWEPPALMVLLLLLGVWIAYGPTIRYNVRPGATTSKVNFGGVKGELEILTVPAGPQDPTGNGSRTELRVLYSDGTTSRTWSAEEFAKDFGPAALASAQEASGNWLFRTLNVTTWWSVAIVGVGLIGQLAFSGRWIVQWIVSEKRRDSVVPESFWWFSFAGGAILFAYFAWRQDIVAVLGQTSGVVVYARNIRLLRKARRRAAREAQVKLGTPPAGPSGEDRMPLTPTMPSESDPEPARTSNGH